MNVSESRPTPESIPSSATNKLPLLANHVVTDLSKTRATEALDIAMTSSQVDRYAQNKIFIPFLHLPMVRYTEKIAASTPSSSKMSCEEVQKALQESEILKKYETEDYSCLSTVCAFLQHAKLAQGQGISVAAALRSFEPDSSKELEKAKSITCTGRTRDFIKNLSDYPGLKNLKAYAVMERASLTATPSHTAAMIPCKDGILFIELMPPPRVLTFRGNEPIVVPLDLGDVQITTTFKIIEVEGDFKVKNIVMSKSDIITEKTGIRTTQTQYLLRGSANPDAPVMNRYLLSMRVYPAITKDSNGNELSIKVNYEEKTVSFERQCKPFSKVKLPFKVFDQVTQNIDLSREEDRAKRALLEAAIDTFSKGIGDPVNKGEKNGGKEKTFEEMWKEFPSWANLKKEVFFIVSDENATIMQDLYQQVKRDRNQLEPPPPAKPEQATEHSRNIQGLDIL